MRRFSNNIVENVKGDKYLWLNIDLQASDIVYMIEMEPAIDPTGLKMPEVEIRVGNEPLASTNSNKHFTQNQLCVSWSPLFETTKMFCENPVMGRYITFQFKLCRENYCISKESSQLAIEEIKVWRIPENTYISSWNAATFPTAFIHIRVVIRFQCALIHRRKLIVILGRE